MLRLEGTVSQVDEIISELVKRCERETGISGLTEGQAVEWALRQLKWKGDKWKLLNRVYT